jgi:hypothetical protein
MRWEGVPAISLFLDDTDAEIAEAARRERTER